MSKDYRTYATASATPTMQAFADFLIQEVYGGELPKGVNEAAFRKGVQLGGSLRMDFQKSDMWKSDARNYLANVEANRAAKATEALEKAKAAETRVLERVAKAKAKAEAALAAAEAAAEAAKAKAA
jgi:hypothetical protein